MNQSIIAQSSLSDRIIKSCCDQSVEGIPNWMAATALAAVLIISHFFINSNMLVKAKKYWQFDLLNKFPSIRKLIKKSYFPMLIQIPGMLVFVLIIYAGFWGNQKPGNNIAPVLIWTIWWISLIFLCTGFATAFCGICPFEGFSSVFSSLSFKSRLKKLGFEFKWPKVLKNVYPALILFIFLTWLELGIDLTKSAKNSALLALAFLVLAVLMALIFERRAFCRYTCLVGRISGLYALFSPLEIRAKSRDVCRSCKTKDCYKGNEKGEGCPTMEFPGGMAENNYCTMCTECVRTCPHDNMALNVRSVAADLIFKSRFRFDEALFAVVLLALTSFHGITMTPAWNILKNDLRARSGFGDVAIFTVLMVIMIIVPVLLFWFSAWCTKLITSGHSLSTKNIFKAYAYSLIPVALFYHLAHNGMHFFMEAQNIIPLLSDPFGWNWNLFGTANQVYAPMMSLSGIWYLQVFLIVTGHLFGVIIADRVSKVLFKSRSNFIKSLIPQLIVMIFYSSFSIWLIAQPMEMRTGM